jgi:hypothetical protein
VLAAAGHRRIVPETCRRLPPPHLRSRVVRALRISLFAVAALAGTALAEPPKSDMELALAKAKKEKKLVAMVFTQFG